MAIRTNRFIIKNSIRYCQRLQITIRYFTKAYCFVRFLLYHSIEIPKQINKKLFNKPIQVQLLVLIKGQTGLEQHGNQQSILSALEDQMLIQDFIEKSMIQPHNVADPVPITLQFELKQERQQYSNMRQFQTIKEVQIEVVDVIKRIFEQRCNMIPDIVVKQITQIGGCCQ